jgi:hypothetical protein
MATGWTAGVRFPAGAKDFSLLHIVQTGSGARPYPTGTVGWKSGQLVKLTTHLRLVLRSRMVELYLHSPTLLHGMVLE